MGHEAIKTQLEVVGANIQALELLRSTTPATIGARLAAEIEQFAGYSENTRKSLRACWRVWAEYALMAGLPVFPPTRQDIEGFLVAQIRKKRKVATLQQYLFALDQMYQYARLANPMKDKVGRQLWKKLLDQHELEAEQEQKTGFGRRELVQVMNSMSGNQAAEVRDRALLLVAYETLTRRSELSSMTVERLTRKKDGSGGIKLGKTKTDRTGKGKRLPLTAEAIRRVDEWLALAKVDSGPIWRSVPARWSGATPLPKPLQAQEVARIVKRRLEQAGIDPETFSGHSLRIGAAQDLVVSGKTDAQIMQAGRWTSPAMVARYTEHLRDADNAMMQLRSEQAEDDKDDD